MNSFINFTKYSALSLILSVFLVFAYSVDAHAYKYRAKPAATVLPPGGNTIGGPGFYDSRVILFRVYGGPSIPVCITVTNVGKNEIKFQPTPTGGDLVFPNETTTRCYDSTNILELACQGGEGTCRAYWRVDSM